MSATRVLLLRQLLPLPLLLRQLLPLPLTLLLATRQLTLLVALL